MLFEDFPHKRPAPVKTMSSKHKKISRAPNKFYQTSSNNAIEEAQLTFLKTAEQA